MRLYTWCVSRFFTNASTVSVKRGGNTDGLPSPYFSLEWTQAVAGDMAIGPNAQGEVPGPPIAQAMKQQLGLKLESTKGPVELLVIDHVEKPTMN